MIKTIKKLLSNTVALFVVLIVFLIIVPLPTVILDFMFIVQIGISLIVLLTTIYIKETLEFSIFPTLLLVLTIFRLGLNISSTRAILTNDSGYAGEMIEAFGNFVIGEEVVVGLIIFLIIVLVQMLVITKGSERVAEVSARFTLDAMPGKQMAIDADLSAGIIDEKEARKRRSKIQRESDFFGSMDGASKFVKGDSIMSIVTTLINLVGGIIIGMVQGGNDIGTVFDTYARSTVGDGLMSQIPSLMISVSSGLMVTRSASEANINADIGKQFLSQPRVLLIAGCTLLCTILIGFPPVQVIIFSAILIGMSFMLTRQQKKLQQQEAVAEVAPTEEIQSEASFYRNIDNLYGLLNVEQIKIEFGYSLIPLVDEASGGSFLDRVVMFRKQYALDMGFVIPPVQLKDSGGINPNQYAIFIKGEQVASGDVLIDHYLALAPSEEEDIIDGIETVEPAFGIKAKWISEDKKVKAELMGYTLIDPTSVIITHLSEIIKAHAHELLNRQEVNNMLENLKKSNETIVKDIVPAIVSVSDLQKVMCKLLEEKVPVRDMETILETLADYAPKIKDIDMLTEYVRQALKRTISHKFSEAGQMKVVTLDANIENSIMQSVKKVDSGSYLALDQQTIQKIITSTTAELDKIRDLVNDLIIITSPVVRIYYKKLVDQFYPNVVVLSFSEIDNAIQIQALGNISI